MPEDPDTNLFQVAEHYESSTSDSEVDSEEDSQGELDVNLKGLLSNSDIIKEPVSLDDFDVL